MGKKLLTDAYTVLDFIFYPGVTAVQTMGKNSILIQVEKNKVINIHC